MAELTEVALENTVYEWCSTVTGMPFIISNQSTNGVRPALPYGTLQLSSLEYTDMMDVAYSEIKGDDDITETVTIKPIVTFSINIYGDGGKEKMIKLKASVWQTQFREFFQEKKVGFVDMTNVRALPRLIKTDWERRVQSDVRFNVRGEYISTIHTIGTVNIENLDNGDIITIIEP